MARFFSILVGTFFVLIFLPVLDAQGVRKGFGAGLDLNESAAAERWSAFVSAAVASDYCMEFALEHRPRRDESVFYNGVMWGAGRGGATFTRISVWAAANPSERGDFILKNSRGGSEVYKFDGGKFVKVEEADWLKPLCAGLIYSPFDLLMPYKFWEAKYVGAERIGQAVHLFDLTSQKFPNSVVRVALTRDFNAPSQIKTMGAIGAKTAELGAVRKVGDVWIMREASVRDDTTKDKDVLRFTKAKFGLRLSNGVFSPDSSRELSVPADLQRL